MAKFLFEHAEIEGFKVLQYLLLFLLMAPGLNTSVVVCDQHYCLMFSEALDCVWIGNIKLIDT